MTDEPRLFQHTAALYDAMIKHSDSEDGETGTFTGSKVEMFRSINVSQGYYSQLFNSLEELGCIETIVNGRGGGRPSQVKLYHPPALNEFQKIYTKSLTNPSPLDTVRQRVSNIEGRLPQVDLAGVLTDFETRISDLESTIERLEQGRS